MAVIGLSGSGKSTLLRCINRLIDPTEGEILWEGEDLAKFKGDELRHVRRQIGMVFQQFNLVKRSTVLTNVLTTKARIFIHLAQYYGKFLCRRQGTSCASA